MAVQYKLCAFRSNNCLELPCIAQSTPRFCPIGVRRVVDEDDPRQTFGS